MPMYNGNYVAPVWINNVPPAINDTELLAISRTLQNSQIITGSGAPTQYTSGVAGQRYADMDTTPPTIYKLVQAAEDANVWTVDANANGNLALDYDPSSTYEEGQYCIYQGKLYKANQDIDPAEAWTEAHWTQAYLADDVAGNAAEIAGHIANTDNPHSVTAAQAGALGNSSVATVETGTASKNYAVGGLLLIGSTLYKATAPIAQGDTLTVGTNIAAATVEELLDGQAVKKGTVSISATWSGTGPYTQTVTVTGASITANSMVDLQPTAAQLNQLVEDGVTAMTVENSNGTLTLTALGEMPSAAMVMQATVTEVE